MTDLIILRDASPAKPQRLEAIHQGLEMQIGEAAHRHTERWIRER